MIYFRTCRDYEHAYREGCIGKNVEVSVMCTSHTEKEIIEEAYI